MRGVARPQPDAVGRDQPRREAPPAATRGTAPSPVGARPAPGANPPRGEQVAERARRPRRHLLLGGRLGEVGRPRARPPARPGRAAPPKARGPRCTGRGATRPRARRRRPRRRVPARRSSYGGGGRGGRVALLAGRRPPGGRGRGGPARRAPRRPCRWAPSRRASWCPRGAPAGPRSAAAASWSAASSAAAASACAPATAPNGVGLEQAVEQAPLQVAVGVNEARASRTASPRSSTREHPGSAATSVGGGPTAAMRRRRARPPRPPGGGRATGTTQAARQRRTPGAGSADLPSSCLGPLMASPSGLSLPVIPSLNSRAPSRGCGRSPGSVFAPKITSRMIASTMRSSNGRCRRARRSSLKGCDGSRYQRGG